MKLIFLMKTLLNIFCAVFSFSWGSVHDKSQQKNLQDGF